ncbi:MAG: prepilin peptidase [Methylococcaceae bacterium]|nr:prepilin peptidase [Methylococcaceae bacterium]
MESLELLKAYPSFFAFIVTLVGLLVGSFLNVVIYRLPVMMQRNWQQECKDYLGLADEHRTDAEPFNLVFPLSRCPSCSAAIKPYQNIPVVSYIFLQGKCANCAHPIALRYPLIEAFTALTSFMVAWHFGYSLQTLFALLLTWSLIALSFIDIDHQLLPDTITLPVLWIGLLLSIFGLFTQSHDSIIGAIAGYLLLWTVYKVFKCLTGKEGMGYGDFKLLALFGAWLGWQSLPLIIFLSSLVGSIIGISLILFSRHDRNKPIPFGPYLAAAGWIALLWGNTINQFYFNLMGL